MSLSARSVPRASSPSGLGRATSPGDVMLGASAKIQMRLLCGVRPRRIGAEGDEGERRGALRDRDRRHRRALQVVQLVAKRLALASAIPTMNATKQTNRRTSLRMSLRMLASPG